MSQTAEDLFRLAAEKAAIPCTKMTWPWGNYSAIVHL